jgi:putative membrane protein
MTMKKMKIILLTSCLVWVFAGCSNPTRKNSTDVADSINSTRDSGEKVQPNSTMEISEADAKFAVEAASGGMAEVELGKLAQTKATNAQVKDFGAMMVKDHAKANAEMKDLAGSKKIVLPNSLSNEDQKLKTRLASKSGADFDKAYVDAMVDDHKKDIKAFEEARHKVKYPEMQAFIDKTLPVLRMHLQAIQKIHAQLK